MILLAVRYVGLFCPAKQYCYCAQCVMGTQAPLELNPVQYCSILSKRYCKQKRHELEHRVRGLHCTSSAVQDSGRGCTLQPVTSHKSQVVTPGDLTTSDRGRDSPRGNTSSVTDSQAPTNPYPCSWALHRVLLSPCSLVSPPPALFCAPPYCTPSPLVFCSAPLFVAHPQPCFCPPNPNEANSRSDCCINIWVSEVCCCRWYAPGCWYWYCPGTPCISPHPWPHAAGDLSGEAQLALELDLPLGDLPCAPPYPCPCPCPCPCPIAPPPGALRLPRAH